MRFFGGHKLFWLCLNIYNSLSMSVTLQLGIMVSRHCFFSRTLKLPLTIGRHAAAEDKSAFSTTRVPLQVTCPFWALGSLFLPGQKFTLTFPGANLLVFILPGTGYMFSGSGFMACFNSRNSQPFFL